MDVQNVYTLQILLNGVEIELDTTEYSFSLQDSIHQFFPRCQMTLNDETGLLREYLSFQEGMSIQLTYGYRSEELQIPLVVESNQTENSFSTGMMNGAIESSLVHAWKNEQEIESAAYEDLISNIVNEVSDFPFQNKDIEETVISDIWYRPLISQRSFIEDILKNNAYSFDSSDSPFFSFIDSGNNFNFISYFMMYDSSPVERLVLSQSHEDFMQRTNIVDIKPFTNGMDANYKFRNRKIFEKDYDTGEYSFFNEMINEFPLVRSSFEEEPFIGDSTLETGYYDEGLVKPERKDFYKAQRISETRSIYFTERFVVTLSGLNTNLRSGKSVFMDIVMIDDKGKSFSLYWSGKYLIEKSDHVWDGTNSTGYTQLLISRRGVKYPPEYLVKEMAYGNT